MVSLTKVMFINLIFLFDQIKLEIPANQGRKDQTYQAMVTWNLVTGP